MRNIIVDAANINNLNNYSNRINSTLESTIKDIIYQAKRYQNNSLASKTGFVSESVHIGSFNLDSAFKRSTLQAVKEKNGFHGDYKIFNGSSMVAKGEFKHYNSAKQTENAMRGYGDRDLVGPKDQIADIVTIAKKKALKNSNTRPSVSKEHLVVSKKATDAIRKENISSKSKTLKEQRIITKKASRGKVDSVDILPDFKESIQSSAVSGAMSGAKTAALFGGGISVISNMSDVINGNKNTKKAIVDISKDVALCTVDGAVKNAAGSVAKTASIHLTQNITNQAAKRVLGSSAPVIAATIAIDTGKDFLKFANGDMDGEDLAKNVVKNTTTAGGAWAGAEGGAAVGAMVGGPAGAVVGGVLGSIVGAIGIGSLFD